MTPARAQRRLPAEQARAEILDSAERRFANEGYHATRLEDVGADVGVGRSAVLYHFRGKRELYAAVLERLVFPLLERVQADLLGPGPFRERVHAALRTLLDYAAANPNAPKVATRELATSSEEIGRVIRDFAKPFRTLLEMMLAEARRQGTIRRDVDVVRFLSVLVGPVLYYFTAIPTYLGEEAKDLTSPERIASLETDLLSVLDVLLGFDSKRESS